MKKLVWVLALLPLLLLSVSAFGQGSSASLRGTVFDASKAVLTGATITVVNVDTGVEATAKTNDSGVYNFPSLQPGTYNVVAEAEGFQRAVMTDVRLRLGGQISLDFDMAVAGTSTEVEVTGTAENMTLDAGSSTGTVLQENLVAELPILGSNVLDLVNIMGGVVKTENPLTGAGDTTFAGVNASGINISRDGITVNEIRYNSGIAAPNRMNTEMVGEFKMVLSPVDAELGRGAGQIQMITKSGANAFHGSAVWNIQNTALDSREWEDKNQAQVNDPDWRNVNNYTLTASGPIIKNKTFFFVTWDHQISRSRSSYAATVLTPCARKGIYRYLGVDPTYGVATGLANGNTTASIASRDIDDVDENGEKIKRRLYGPTRPNVSIEAGSYGKILEEYTYPVNNTLYNMTAPAGTVGSIELSGKTVNNPLMYQSVLGELSAADREALASSVYTDCSTYNIEPGARVGSGYGNTDNWWTNARNQYDPSRYVYNFSQMMPGLNLADLDYTVGDGLNTAGYRWTRTASGADTVFGTMYDPNRKSITGKVDHNINAYHRLSGTYSYESNYGDDAGNLPTWPGGYGGATDRKPQTFTASLTSTLRPTLLNELRVGLSRTRTHTNNSLNNPKTGDELRQKLLQLLPTEGANWNYHDVIVAGPGSGGMAFFPGTNGHFFGGSYTSSWGGVDPRWTVSDTITWMKGSHSFKGGFEFRRNKSWQEMGGNAQFFGVVNIIPSVQGGVLGQLSPYDSGSYDQAGNFLGGPFSGMGGRTPWEGFSEYEQQDRGSGGLNGKYSSAYDLLTYMSGSVGSISQYFYVTDAKNPRWNRPGDNELNFVTDLRNREFSFFFKDDWKVNNQLTVNLGARYEYYGVPWVDSGLSASVADQIKGMYGVSRNLGTWMPDLQTLQAQGPLDYDNLGTRQIFVGPNSPNANIGVFNKDMNNWAPHVGFAWQLPWFGMGKTTLRGGYSISYQAVSNFDNNFGYGAYLSNSVPGMTYAYNYSGRDGCIDGQKGCYMSFSNLDKLLPLNMALTERLPLGDPKRVVDPARPEGALTIYDPNIRNPYVQSLNLSITRSIGNNLTLDVRYVGTLSRKTVSGLNLNTANYINNGLFDEFAKLRAGYGDMTSLADYPILNSGYIPYRGDPNHATTASLYAPMINGAPLETLSGAQQVLYSQWSNLANGNFNAIATALQTANFDSDLVTAGLRPATASTESGQVLRAGNAPANLIYANPQYGSATIQRNQGRTNYHSMQVQLTMRPVRGLSFQTTYTWSRSLGRGAVLDWNDPNWEMDYSLSSSHRSHQLTSYGTWTLPLGANGVLFREAQGLFKKAVEGWQLGWIATANSGVPMSFSGAATTLWGTSKYVQVGPFDTKDVAVKWNKQTATGTYFNKPYMTIADPQCGTALVSQTLLNPYDDNRPTMSTSCGNSLYALAEIAGQNANGQNIAGQTIFQSAIPGEIGNVQSNSLTGPGRWTLDMNMAKAFELMAGKRIELRIDAQNIFNHPTPSYDIGQYPGFGSYAAMSFGARDKQIVNPNTAISPYVPLGHLNSKAGHRTFQAKLRFSF